VLSVGLYPYSSCHKHRTSADVCISNSFPLTRTWNHRGWISTSIADVSRKRGTFTSTMILLFCSSSVTVNSSLPTFRWGGNDPSAGGTTFCANCVHTNNRRIAQTTATTCHANPVRTRAYLLLGFFPRVIRGHKSLRLFGLCFLLALLLFRVPVGLQSGLGRVRVR